jgi:TatD DNase family protein
VIDSHCHLADDAFEADLDAVVARAQAAGVSEGLCVLAMDEPAQMRRVARVAEAWPALRFAAGIHPHEAARFTGPEPQRLDRVRRALHDMPRVCALGEIGLDYHYDCSPREIQREIFREQVRLAGEMRLPMIVHTREAEDDTRAILGGEAPQPLRGVLHCFTGSAAMAEWAIEAGLYVSFAGILTFPTANELRAIAADVPLDRLLVETDCPYLAPVPLRGQRCEPAFVVEVGRTLARLHDVPYEDVSRAITANYTQLFRP